LCFKYWHFIMKREGKDSFEKLDDSYADEVEPYQVLIESIALQNRILHNLQEQHSRLS
jgi:hypothetical protein